MTVYMSIVSDELGDVELLSAFHVSILISVPLVKMLKCIRPESDNNMILYHMPKFDLKKKWIPIHFTALRNFTNNIITLFVLNKGN